MQIDIQKIKDRIFSNETVRLKIARDFGLTCIASDANSFAVDVLHQLGQKPSPFPAEYRCLFVVFPCRGHYGRSADGSFLGMIVGMVMQMRLHLAEQFLAVRCGTRVLNLDLDRGVSDAKIVV